ncbi:MAG: VWA domain-containing protein [archaeon]|nr:VWA domain-containing protein [archaeon]
MSERPVNLPFTAVVGMDDCKKALECALVSPHVKTVLIRGGTGAAKTVLSRSLSGISGKKVVNCPPNIGEEELFGGLDVEATVSEGRPVMRKGLLSRADGNILYVDDIDLMERSVLSGLLTATIDRDVVVERGPISSRYRVDTVLVATINPMDSDLSDHMLDRFDLCAYASDEDSREVLKRLYDFEMSPESLESRFSEEQEAEMKKIDRAARILPIVEMSDELLNVISELCAKVGAGIRGDLAMVNCSKCLAALNGRDTVTKKDVEEAAILCLPHRRDPTVQPPEPPQPPEEPDGQDEDGEDTEEPPDNNDNDRKDDGQEEQDGQDEEESRNDDEPLSMEDLEDMLFEIGRQFRVIDYLGSRTKVPSRTKTRKGRRAMAVSADGTGRYARSREPLGRTSDIAFDATVRAAAPYQNVRHSDQVSIVIEKRDIREKVRERRSGCTIMFLVDASGSLGVRKRMSTVKGAIMSMLRDSYVRRDRIGLSMFRRDSCEVILPPTKSVEYSYRCLEELPTGGKTPLGEALLRTEEYMRSYARCHVGENCFIVLVTDGRANVPLEEGRNANDEVQKLAEDLDSPHIGWIVVDAGAGFPHFDNAEKLAEKLEARYFRLEDLDADRFAESIRNVIDG